MGFTVKVVERDGTEIATLANPADVSVTKTLRSEETFSFAAPKYDPTTAEVGLLGTEVQIFKGADPVPKAWGPVLSDDASSGDGAVKFSGAGSYWYFRRRMFGTADRLSSIVNGDFEDGTADGTLDDTIPDWTAVGGSTWHYTTATKPDPAYPDPLTGTKAVGTFAVPNDDAYLKAVWEYRTDFPPGQRVTAAGWVNTFDWAGPAVFKLGIYLEYSDGGELIRSASVELPQDTNTIAGNDDGWVRLQVSMIVPPGIDGEMEARFYMPGGLAVWDTTQSVLMESSGSGLGADQATIAANVIDYAQTGRGKSDLYIGTDCPTTGVIRKRSWQHADHEWISAAIEAVSDFDDGFDFRVDIDDDATRTFRTFFPYAGTERRGDVTLSYPGNVASYQRPRDASGVSTSVIVSAPGISGPTREEGLAQDLAALDGLVLEERSDAPDDLSVGELDDYAATRLADVVDVTPSLTLVITDPDLIELLEDPGDLVDVVIDDGYVQEAGEYRIVQTTLSAVSMELVLNPWNATERPPDPGTSEWPFTEGDAGEIGTDTPPGPDWWELDDGLEWADQMAFGGGLGLRSSVGDASSWCAATITVPWDELTEATPDEIATAADGDWILRISGQVGFYPFAGYDTTSGTVGVMGFWGIRTDGWWGYISDLQLRRDSADPSATWTLVHDLEFPNPVLVSGGPSDSIADAAARIEMVLEMYSDGRTRGAILLDGVEVAESIDDELGSPVDVFPLAFSVQGRGALSFDLTTIEVRVP